MQLIFTTIVPVVVLDSVLVFIITHTSTWFLDRELHQLVADEPFQWEGLAGKEDIP